MTAIATLTENYDGAAAGAAISTTNTIFDNVSGTGTSNLFHGSFPTGTVSKSNRMVCGAGNHINRADITPVTVLYFSFYLYVEAAPSLIGAILNWYSALTKIGDLRLDVDGTLSLRDAAIAKWTSTALAAGEWHRIEVKIDPGSATGHLVNVWSGSNINGTTTPSQTSGGQPATQAGLAGTATVSDVRMGSIGNDASLILRFSRLRGDDAAFPTPIVESDTVNAGPDQTGVAGGATVTLTATGTGSSAYAWSQTAGTTVTLTGTGATRTFTAPSTGTAQTLTFTATKGTATDSVNVGVLATSATAPISNAGPDQANIVPFSTVTLTGAASTDPDGTISSYAWTQTAGSPTVTLTGTGATRTFIAPATMAGTTLTFQLLVTDNSGLTSTDTVTVQVINHNRWVVAPDGVGRLPLKHYSAT